LPAPTPALVTPAPVAPAVVAAKEPKPASVPVAAQVPAVVAIAKPPVDHPAERKVVAFAKPATPMPVIKTPESRPAEPRVAEARPNDARPVAASVSQPPMARPTVLAATRPGAGYIPAAAPVATQAAAPAQQQYSGSLLGMARSGTSPAPRPMPVSTAQWSNAN
jgi:hypothetical protein